MIVQDSRLVLNDFSHLEAADRYHGPVVNDRESTQ